MAMRHPLPQPLLAARTKTVDRSSQCIIIVEDEPDISDLLSDVFATEGYRVLAASDADSALQLVRSHQPDVITLDLGLPNRDGRQLLHDLKNDDLTRSIPVIVISACCEQLEPSERLLVAAVVDKPFQIAHLLRTIARTLTSRQMESA